MLAQVELMQICLPKLEVKPPVPVYKDPVFGVGVAHACFLIVIRWAVITPMSFNDVLPNPQQNIFSNYLVFYFLINFLINF